MKNNYFMYKKDDGRYLFILQHRGSGRGNYIYNYRRRITCQLLEKLRNEVNAIER